jgi:flavin-dependent dehydrogenase
MSDLGLDVPRAAKVDDMVVVGPTGRRVRLPCYPGTTYPGYALACPRSALDASLQAAAVSAGAEAFVGRAAEPIFDDASLVGFELSSGELLRADVVIGADGASSRVAEVAGLVDSTRVLWGFALRAYIDDPVTVPHIVLWEPSPWHGFPGYGWLFPWYRRSSQRRPRCRRAVGSAGGLERRISTPSSSICGSSRDLDARRQPSSFRIASEVGSRWG